MLCRQIFGGLLRILRFDGISRGGHGNRET